LYPSVSYFIYLPYRNLPGRQQSVLCYITAVYAGQFVPYTQKGESIRAIIKVYTIFTSLTEPATIDGKSALNGCQETVPAIHPTAILFIYIFMPRAELGSNSCIASGGRLRWSLLQV